MRTVKILHLYAEAMDLYGDVKNLEVLCQRIRESGNAVEVTTCDIWDKMCLDGFDMVYMGHGKARNLAAMEPHFMKYADAVKAKIEEGQLWFVTGNARELFGKDFTTVEEKLCRVSACLNTPAWRRIKFL
jgi:CobQ-like glutamine amidotransferase family enzyme